MGRTLAIRITTWCFVGFLLVASARAEEPDPEAALSEAWYLLEVERNPAEAARRYERWIGTDHAPSIRARALLGLSRATRLLGREAEAQRFLDEAFRLSPELRALREGRPAGNAGEGPDRYVTGWVDLQVGEGLDLDAGGVYPGLRTWTGGKVELFNGPGGLGRPDGAVEDAAFARCVAVSGPRPWLRVETDEGRLAWFQVLLPGTSPMLRFVIRVSGSGSVLPEVRGAYALGRDRDGGTAGGVELYFEPTLDFASYRVEARRAGEGAYEALGEARAPPFVHAAAPTGERYDYRITGFDEAGNAGIPTELIGSSRSAGIVSGTIEMRRGQAFDLLSGTERSVAGDLELVNTAGGASAAHFVDARGRAVRAVAFERGPPRAVWEGTEPPTQAYVEDGGLFLVPLLGGGLARCRLEMLGRRGNPPEILARVHYETQPDGIAFPPAPVLQVERAREGVRILATGLEATQTVPFVVAHDLLRDVPPRTVRHRAAPGVFLDAEVGRDDERVLRYEATPVDADGRRGVTGSVVFDGRPSGVRTGTFRMHYQQGFSFARGRIVQAAEADVFFAGCAGGISSITLAAPGGITNLERSLRPPLLEDRHAGDAERLAECVVGLDPDRVRLEREADGDRRRPAADVFVLRLRDGGWARLAIVDRDERAEGGWTKLCATFAYAWNPKEPVFAEGDAADAAPVRGDGYHVVPLEQVLERRRREVLGHLPPEPVTGTFAIKYREGYSFENRLVVDDENEADVFVASCAGGIASITFEAPGGIANLSALHPAGVWGEREALFDAILGADEDALRQARVRGGQRGDAREPPSDVFLLRTRNGGWVKMAVLERSDVGDWHERLIKGRYVFNPHAPVFDTDDGDAVTVGPLRVRAAAESAFAPTRPEPAALRQPPAEPPPEAYLTPDDEPPPAGAPWLASYRTGTATADAYDRLRTHLLRSPDDAFVVAGLVYLAGAHDPWYRRLAARALGGAYLLGAQGGEGAADALRRLARDPDHWVRHSVLSMGQVLDTPLSRELLLRHLAGRAPVPEGDAWSWVRSRIAEKVERYRRTIDLRALVAAGDEEALARWVEEAPTRPASETADRFQVVDLTEGEPCDVVLDPGDPAMGDPGRTLTLTASDFRVVRSEVGPSSGDYAFLGDGHGGVGGATPYGESWGGSGDEFADTLRRVIGEGRLRVYRRPSRQLRPR